MKILLVQPPKGRASLAGEDFYRYEPLALEMLAAAVRPHHDVRILDLRLEPRLAEVLEETAPDVVGVTAYTVNVNPALSICAAVKARDPRCLTVVGGHHATVRPQDFTRPAVDLVVEGDGERPLLALLERHERGAAFDGIPGVRWVEGGALAGTAPGALGDIDAGPLPDRSLTARYRGRYFSEWMRPLAAVRTSRGCPYRCTFCALWRLTNGRHLQRSAERVVEELRAIEEPFVFFADDESMVEHGPMTRLADAIERAGIRKRYFCYGRSDTIARHPELIDRWRAIGLERIFVGVEFFRDEDLAYVNKRSSIAVNEKALQILADKGVEVYASFMVRPELTREDFRAFRAYVRSLPLSFAAFSILTPLPGTELYEARQAELVSHNWDHFDFLHSVLPTRLPAPEFYAEYADLLAGAVPLGKSLRFLRRFPVRELPGFVSRSGKLLRRIRNAWRDDAAGASEAAARPH